MQHSKLTFTSRAFLLQIPKLISSTFHLVHCSMCSYFPAKTDAKILVTDRDQASIVHIPSKPQSYMRSYSHQLCAPPRILYAIAWTLLLKQINIPDHTVYPPRKHGHKGTHIMYCWPHRPTQDPQSSHGLQSVGATSHTDQLSLRRVIIHNHNVHHPQLLHKGVLHDQL